jgi:hypothetical protein
MELGYDAVLRALAVAEAAIRSRPAFAGDRGRPPASPPAVAPRHGVPSTPVGEALGLVGRLM